MWQKNGFIMFLYSLLEETYPYFNEWGTSHHPILGMLGEHTTYASGMTYWFYLWIYIYLYIYFKVE